jgi:hypothetical protein
MENLILVALCFLTLSAAEHSAHARIEDRSDILSSRIKDVGDCKVTVGQPDYNGFTYVSSGFQIVLAANKRAYQVDTGGAFGREKLISNSEIVLPNQVISQEAGIYSEVAIAHRPPSDTNSIDESKKRVMSNCENKRQEALLKQQLEQKNPSICESGNPGNNNPQVTLHPSNQGAPRPGAEADRDGQLGTAAPAH